MTNIEDKKAKLLRLLGSEQVAQNEQISVNQVDYEAELYQEVSSAEGLVKSITAAREADLPFFILGNGYIPEPGIEKIAGLVIKNNCRKFAILSMRGKISSGEGEKQQAFVTAETGVSINQLVRFTIDEGLGGLEYFLGAAGTLGDGLAQHLYYEKENDYFVSHIFTLRILTKENEVIEVNAEPFLHPFTTNMLEKKHAIPLSVVFHLTPSEKSDLWKKATRAAFERNQQDLLDPLKGNFNY